MKFELFSSNPESFESIQEMEKGVILEHFGIKEQVEIPETNEFSDNIYGTPEKDAEHWHKQIEPLSCAITCQEFVAEQLTGKEFNESDLIKYAEQNGWYHPEEGTSINDVGKLLESIGITVERGENYTLNDLANALEDGNKVICGVNNRTLHNPIYANMPGIRANHAVQVIGIDATNPNNIEVIVNDPGTKNGKGLRIDGDTFVKAWNTGDNFAVIAKK